MAVVKHTFANIVGAVAPLAVNIVTIPAYLHLIGEARYGILALVWLVLGYFGFFHTGLGQATAQNMARLESDGDRGVLLRTSMVLSLILGIAGGLILWVFAGLLLNHLPSASARWHTELLGAAPLVLIAFPVLTLTSSLRGALQGREKFVEINYAGALGEALAQVLPLIVAWLGFSNLAYLIGATLAGRVITSFLMLMQCARHIPFHHSYSLEYSRAKELLKYGGWSSSLSTVAPLLVTFDRLVIGALAGAKAVAYYTVPYGLVSKLTILPGSLSDALFPKLAALPFSEAHKLAAHSTQILAAIMTPIVIIAMTFIHPVLRIWIGASFATHNIGVGEVIIFGVWINSVVFPHNARLHAQAKQNRIFLIYLVELPIYAMLLWFGVKNFGIVGAAGAWSLRVLLDTTLLLLLAGSFRLTLAQVRSSMILVAIAYLVTLLMDENAIIRWAIMGGLVLASLVLNKKFYTRDELRRLA